MGIKNILFVVLLAVVSSTLVWADDYADGMDANLRHDYKTSFRLLNKSAQQGNTEAQFYIGLMYDTGQGIPQDSAKAVEWYRLAAQQRHTKAQLMLAGMYSLGKRVLQDKAEAVKWYRLAAQQGDASAQYHLGFNYYTGQGVPQDYVKAHLWSNISAAAGEIGAVGIREDAERKMTPNQIAEAQQMARDCVASNFKGCN